MLSKNEILEIALSELRKNKLNTKVKFLNKEDFLIQAMKSPIILKSFREGCILEELNIQALTSLQKNEIYFSEEVLKKLLFDEPISIQIRYIKAVIYHEIFHLLNKKKIIGFNTAMNSEDEATKKFKKNYPSLASLGERISKKYISL